MQTGRDERSEVVLSEPERYKDQAMKGIENPQPIGAEGEDSAPDWLGVYWMQYLSAGR